MSDTLLVVLGHSTVSDTIARHYPWWLKAECDILCVGREDTITKWPYCQGQERCVGEIRVGEESYAAGDNHIRRFLDVLRYCLDHTKYSSFMLIEYDVILFRALSGLKLERLWFVTTVAGGQSEGFRGSCFFHTPWWLGRFAAREIIVLAERMLRAGLNEQGFLDRFLGLLVDLYEIPVTDLSGKFWYSQNTIDTPEKIAEARAAIANNCVGIHGVKTKEVLDAITKDLT